MVFLDIDLGFFLYAGTVAPGLDRRTRITAPHAAPIVFVSIVDDYIMCDGCGGC